jgi:cytochrome c2
MRHKLLIISISLFAVLITACSDVSAVETELVGDPELGREIYEDHNRTRCEGCHTLDGSDIRGGPSLLGISERAGDRIPELSAVEYLQQSILEPSAYVVEGFEDKMKSYQLVDPGEVDFMLPGMLTHEELDNLIAFLLTQ